MITLAYMRLSSRYSSDMLPTHLGNDLSWCTSCLENKLMAYPDGNKSATGQF
jgi:hypothetical protein